MNSGQENLSTDTLTEYRFQYPEHREFADLWLKACANGTLPTRQRFPLSMLAEFADRLLIMRIDEARPGYVIYSGLHMVERWGADMMGKNLREVMPPAFADIGLSILGKMVDLPYAVVSEMGFGQGHEQVVDSTTLYLPVYNEDAKGLCVYAMTLPYNLPSLDPAELVKGSIWVRVIPLDIGKGVPFAPYELMHFPD